MKRLSIILITISLMASTITVNAAPVPRESAPCNATEHQILVAESFISGILDEVKNGMGYADAKAKSNRIFFNAQLNGQTSGYSYGEIDYTKVEFNARVKIYQSVNPAFNPDEEFAKDTCYRDIPSVDNSLFTIARKLLIETKK